MTVYLSGSLYVRIGGVRLLLKLADIQQDLINKALEIDLDYTNQISQVLKKHIEKLNLDGVTIPQEVIIERTRLRNECNQKIIDLGVTDFSYRQTDIRL